MVLIKEINRDVVKMNRNENRKDEVVPSGKQHVLMLNGKLEMKVRYVIDDDGCWITTTHWNSRLGTLKQHISERFEGKNLIKQIYSATHEDEIGSTEHVIRKCGNKRCINPSHMLKVNDDVFKKIQAMNNGAYKKNNGKLGREEVLDIFNSNERISDVAERYSVSRNEVERIRGGKSYTEITGGKKGVKPMEKVVVSRKRNYEGHVKLVRHEDRIYEVSKSDVVGMLIYEQTELYDKNVTVEELVNMVEEYTTEYILRTVLTMVGKGQVNVKNVGSSNCLTLSDSAKGQYKKRYMQMLGEEV